MLAWLQSGDRKNFTSVSRGSGFLIKWSFAYTLHQAWQSTTDEAKVLVLFVAGNDIAWWCIPDDLNSISPKGGDPSGFEWTRSGLVSPIGVTNKWTQVDPSGLEVDPLLIEFPNNNPSKVDPTPV